MVRMTYSYIQKSGSNFTDTAIKKLQLDPLVIEGSLYRLDFLSALSNPNADGALSNGSVFKNLVQGAPDATFTAGTVNPTITAGKKGLLLPGNVNTAAAITFPAGNFDMHTEGGDHNFIHHCWFHELSGYPASSASIVTMRDSANNNSPIWGATPSAYTLYTGPAGANPYAAMRSNGGGYGQSPTVNDALVGAPHLLSMGYFNGSVINLVDGAIVSTDLNGSAALGIPACRSHGTLVFSANPAAADTVTVNGTVITFVAAGAAGPQINIGVSATATAQALKAYIVANKAALGTFAEGAAATLTVLTTTPGVSVTLAKSSANITVGAPIPGVQLRILANAKGTIFSVSGEDLSVSGRSVLASAQAEYVGYRAKLVAAGLA
jgi:hypothetical protein